MTTVPTIIDKYEVPKEYQDALYEAFTDGVKRGYIDAMIINFNESLEAENA